LTLTTFLISIVERKQRGVRDLHVTIREFSFFVAYNLA
jgi:hypothetical protein